MGRNKKKGGLSEEQKMEECFERELALVEGKKDICLTTTFNAALRARRTGDIHAENLYLETASLNGCGLDARQIDLFNLVATRVPQVNGTIQLAREFILNQATGKQLAVLDIGIGTGRTYVNLMPELKQRGLEELIIAGIEPFRCLWDDAKPNIQAAGRAHGVNVRFTGLQQYVERVSRREWSELADFFTSGPPPIVTASYTLHHIKGEDNPRTRVLQSIRNFLNPSFLILLEPDVMHHDDNFDSRFVTCLEHFAETFRVIDTIDIEEPEKTSLKLGFFGREIVDIVGKPDASRTENHESRSVWKARLHQAGFTPVQLPEVCQISNHVAIKQESGTYSFQSKKNQFPLTALLIFTPSRSPSLNESANQMPATKRLKVQLANNGKCKRLRPDDSGSS